MSKSELLARIVELERRIAVLEARSQTIPYTPYTPYVSPPWTVTCTPCDGTITTRSIA